MEEGRYRNNRDDLGGISRHDGSTPNQHTSIQTSSFQTERKNWKEKEDAQGLTEENKSPAQILDFSKFESKENTRQIDTKMFAVSNTEEIAAQMQRKALVEQNQNVKQEEVKRTGFSVFTNLNIGTKYYGQKGRVGSRSPRRSPVRGTASAKLAESKRQMKFNSPKADESKQESNAFKKECQNDDQDHRAKNGVLQAHTKSVIEYSNTHLNSDFKQQNNVNMQIDRLQLLHGVLDSGLNEGSYIRDRPIPHSELKHAESPKKVPPFTLKEEPKSYDRHRDSIKKSDSKSNTNFGDDFPDQKSNLKNEQNLINQSVSQNISARYSQINVANNHVNHLSSSNIQNNFNIASGSNKDLVVNSKQREAVGRTPKVEGNREGDMEQNELRSTYTKVEEYMNRDRYNETSASQLQLNSKNMSTIAKANPREQTPNYLQGRSSLINTYSTHGGLTGLAQNHLKSTIVEIHDNISNNGGTFTNQLEKCDLERESNLTPNANKPSYHVPNYPSNVSQLSGQYRQQSSISPTRSVIGLTSLAGNQNKDKVEQALQERVNKGLEEIYRLKKESRAKEQEYEKKIALQEQQIELLTLQVKETEQREQQQRSMYDKMFVALEHGNATDFTQSAGRGKKPEEMFNSTQMSFGKEIEQMQKQFQDEMQARINELENMLNTKEQELIYEAQKNEQKLNSLTKNFQIVSKENQDLKLQNVNLQRLLDGKIEEQNQSQSELQTAQAEMQQLKIKQQNEIEMIEKDTQAKYDELKSVYQAAQTSKNDKDSAQQKMNNIQMDIEYLDRIHDLEKQIKTLTKEHQEAANVAMKEAAEKEANISQLNQQLQAYEQKTKSKKEKIKGLQLEYGEKNRECERQRMKNEQLEEQLKQMVNTYEREMNQIKERYVTLKRDQEGEWEKKEQEIKKEQDLEHDEAQEGNAEAQLRQDEKDQALKAIIKITDTELNFGKVKDEAEIVDNSQFAEQKKACAFDNNQFNNQLGPIETYGCKDSQDDEKSPATQRNELYRNQECMVNEQEPYCGDENCSPKLGCSRCLRNQTQQRQYANQHIQPRSKSQNSRPAQRSTSSQTRIQTKAGSQQSRSRQSNCGTDANADRAHNSASASRKRSHQQSQGQKHSQKDIESGQAHFLRNSQNFDCYQRPSQPEYQHYQNLVEITYQDLQLFNRLKKMIDATAQMECIGCQKLIPTIQFYEHLIESNDGDTEEEQLAMQSQMQLNAEEFQKMTQNHQQFNQFDDESISDANCLAISNSNLHNVSHGAYLNPHQDSQQRVGAFQTNPRPSRSKSAGRPATNRQQQLLAQSQLVMTGQPFLAEDTFKPKLLEQSQKYRNALTIIKKQQVQESQLRAQLQEFQEVIQNQDQTLAVYSHQLQQKGADGSRQLLQSVNSGQLQNSETEEMQQLKDEKQRMQLSMDRLKLQLEQKKTQLALLEEKKAENELELKKEKKFLLESFLKAREENKLLIEMQQQHFMEAQCSNDQFTQNQQNYNDDQIINENDFDLQNYENNGEDHPFYGNNDESQQLINLQQFELQSQHSTQNQINMNLNKTDYILASGFSTHMNSQVANMRALNPNQYQACPEQNYQASQQNQKQQQQNIEAAQLAGQKKYRLKIIDSSHTNTRGTNSQYQSASNISRASVQLPGSQQQYFRRNDGAEHHSGGGDLDDDVNDLSSKRRQDDETLSQIEELEKKLDQQMSGMYEHHSYVAHQNAEPFNNLGDGRDSSKRNSLRQSQVKNGHQLQQHTTSKKKGYIVNPQSMHYYSMESQGPEAGHPMPY